MRKINLPVIVLKGIVLLPNNDIRLEFQDNGAKNIIDVSEMFHDNKLLVMEINSGVMMSNLINQLDDGYLIAKEIYLLQEP